ncbi:MAG: HAD family hydrolase [Bacteroides sp.]
MKTIILDFDGTIADTRNSIIQTIQATLKDLNIPKVDDSSIGMLIGLPLRETFIQACHLTEEDVLQKATKLYRDKYNQISLDTVKLFPHVKEVLKELHNKGAIITVASSKGKEALLALLDRLEIAQYIKFIVGEQDVENKKLAPDMALLILKQTKSISQETLVVGDTIYDIEMGQEAHCNTCGVTYGNNTIEQLKEQKPDYIVDDFTAIINIFERKD